MVCWWLMFSVLQIACHRPEVNWAPLSDVMMSYTPKLATHSSSSTLTHVAANVYATRNASGHLVDLSMMVNRRVAPPAAGSGPTRSTWMREKRLSGTWQWALEACGRVWSPCHAEMPDTDWPTRSPAWLSPATQNGRKPVCVSHVNQGVTAHASCGKPRAAVHMALEA